MSYLPPNTGENYEVVSRGSKYIWVRKTMNDKKIYIFVSKVNNIVGTYGLTGQYPVSCGRAAAQASHAIAALQYNMRIPLSNITTIIVQVPTENELKIVIEEAKRTGIQYADFYDSLDYSTENFLTAVALAPVVPDEVSPLLRLMPLWGCK